MILSHSKEFIFIKPQKTAGTSVELLLTKLCDASDIITPFIYEPDKNIRAKHGAKSPANYFSPKSLIDYSMRDIYRILRYGYWPGDRYGEHYSAAQIRQLAGYKIWNDYLKISIIRNPWDHAVSYYNWRVFRGKTYSFEEYVEQHYTSIWNIISSESDQMDIDFIIRYENLNEDVCKLMKKLGSTDDLALPGAKTNIRKDRDYKKLYNDHTIEVVRKKNEKLLAVFPYQFD